MNDLKDIFNIFQKINISFDNKIISKNEIDELNEEITQLPKLLEEINIIKNEIKVLPIKSPEFFEKLVLLNARLNDLIYVYELMTKLIHKHIVNL